MITFQSLKEIQASLTPARSSPFPSYPGSTGRSFPISITSRNKDALFLTTNRSIEKSYPFTTKLVRFESSKAIQGSPTSARSSPFPSDLGSPGRSFPISNSKSCAFTTQLIRFQSFKAIQASPTSARSSRVPSYLGSTGHLFPISTSKSCAVTTKLSSFQSLKAIQASPTSARPSPFPSYLGSNGRFFPISPSRSRRSKGVVIFTTKMNIEPKSYSFTTKRFIFSSPDPPATCLIRLHEEIGETPVRASKLGPRAGMAASLEGLKATVAARVGSMGFMNFLELQHGPWFKLHGLTATLSDGSDDQYTPETIVQVTFGNPVILATMARHDFNALLMAPIRMLLYSNGRGGTDVMWDLPSTYMSAIPKQDRPEELVEALEAFDNKMEGFVRWVAYGQK